MGSSLTITFNIGYNATTSQSGAQSGDTASVKLAGIQYTVQQTPDVLNQTIYSGGSPVMMLTNGVAGLYILYSDTAKLQTGLTKIISLGLAGTNVISITTLPLRIETSQAIINDQLIVKDYRGNILNTTTSVSGNNYTIQLPPGLVFDDPDNYNYTIYANVKSIQSHALIKTSLQPSSKFSWIDVNSYNRKVFTTQNTKFITDYPTGSVISHN